jgi:hypothetical protein
VRPIGCRDVLQILHACTSHWCNLGTRCDAGQSLAACASILVYFSTSRVDSCWTAAECQLLCQAAHDMRPTRDSRLVRSSTSSFSLHDSCRTSGGYTVSYLTWGPMASILARFQQDDRHLVRRLMDSDSHQISVECVHRRLALVWLLPDFGEYPRSVSYLLIYLIHLCQPVNRLYLFLSKRSYLVERNGDCKVMRCDSSHQYR